jgi:hypothetical protein
MPTKPEARKPDGNTIEITAKGNGTPVNAETPHKKSYK